MLGALLERVLLQTIFGRLETLSDFFELLTLESNLVSQAIVLMLELFVLITLLRVQIVQTSLIGKVDIVDLLLIRVQFVLHISFLSEKGVQVRALLVILVLNMHE